MKFFLIILISFVCVATQSQISLDSIFCEESPEYYLDYGFLNEELTKEEAYDYLIQSMIVSSEVTLVPWQWSELGPTRTPEESKESKALPSYSLGRGTGTGRINDLYINPQNENQVFACSPTGGLFYSRNKGESWSSAGTDGLPISGVSSVTVNPLDDKNWIISTGDGDDKFMFSAGVYRTFDEGKTWEQINGKFNYQLPVKENIFNFYISEVVAHPCDFNKQFLATSHGLYRSGNANTEKGKSVKWKQLSSERFYDIELCPLDETILAAGGEHLWISSNCGKHWKKVTKPSLERDENYGLFRLSVEFSSEDKDLIYVCVLRKKALGKGSIGPGYLFKYSIKNDTWTEINKLTKFGNVIPTRGRAFEKNPINDSIILIGNVKPVRISDDFGQTFVSVESNQMHDDIHDFEFFSDGITVLASHDGGVSISSDGGLSWKPWDKGIGAANVHGLSVGQTEDHTLLYGAYDTGCYLFKNNTWSHVSFGDGFETVVHSKDSSKMLVTMQNGYIYKSTNTGEEFTDKVKMKGHRSSWHTWVKSNLEYPNVLYQSGSNVGRSLDFGETWEVILNPSDIGFSGRAWRCYQTDGFPDHLFVIVLGSNRSEDRILFSPNPNDTILENIVWRKLPKCPKEGWVSSIIKSEACETCHTVSFNSFSETEKVYYFDGEKYRDISFNLGFSSVRSGVRDKVTGRIYLGTKQGVFTKLPNQSSWTLLTGLPGARIRGLSINYKRNELYVGTFGRGIWSGKLLR